jgi:hypothetical protein
MKAGRRTPVLICLEIMLVPFMLCAQTELGTVRGIISKTGSGEALAGVEISLQSGSSGPGPVAPGAIRPNVAISDSTGRFCIKRCSNGTVLYPNTIRWLLDVVVAGQSCRKCAAWSDDGCSL